MKQMNKSNKFNAKGIEKFSICTCGERVKLKTSKNYPHGKKSKPEISPFYKCEKCGEIRQLIQKQKGGRK